MEYFFIIYVFVNIILFQIRHIQEHNMTDIGINGFGRMGRLGIRAAWGNQPYWRKGVVLVTQEMLGQ